MPDGPLKLITVFESVSVEILLSDLVEKLNSMHSFSIRDSFEAILSLSASETTLFASTQDGGIKVFDLETRSQIRLIVGHEVRALLERVGTRLNPPLTQDGILLCSSRRSCR